MPPNPCCNESMVRCCDGGLIEVLAVVFVILVLALLVTVAFILGRNRNMANFQQMNEAISALQTTTNQMGATSARAIGVIQSPDADQPAIDAATARIVDIEQQLASINQELNAALPPAPTPQPLRK